MMATCGANGDINLCWTPTSGGMNCTLSSSQRFGATIGDGHEDEEVEVSQLQDVDDEIYYATEFVPDGFKIRVREE